MDDENRDLKITLKEAEILRLSALGCTRVEIGRCLNISPHTVDYHVRNSVKKLQASNITSAVVIAFKKKLFTLDE